MQIRARQQERRQEVQQAKRQKLGTRYSVIVAAVLLIGSVSFFLVEHQTLAAILSGVIVLVALVAVVAVLNLGTPTRKATARPRRAPSASTATPPNEKAAPATGSEQAEQSEAIADDVPLPSADPDSD